jgi:hypothetical protein
MLHNIGKTHFPPLECPSPRRFTNDYKQATPLNADALLKNSMQSSSYTLGVFGQHLSQLECVTMTLSLTLLDSSA